MSVQSLLVPTRQDIANQLRSTRLALRPRPTQEQVAEAAGVGQQTVSDWENGVSYPRKVSELKGLARVLELDLDELIELIGAVDVQEATDRRQRLTDTSDDVLLRLARLERRVEELAEKQEEAERLRELARQRQPRRPRSSAQR